MILLDLPDATTMSMRPRLHLVRNRASIYRETSDPAFM
jgi:hypothetical protein